MPTLDEKINEHFPGRVVRKDLTAKVKGNAVVPTYVLEYLLGQYCATDDEASIEKGVENVRKIINRHYVHREEAELVKSTIRDKGNYRIIDRITVALNDRRDVHEASFTNLGLRKVVISDDWVRKFPKLLTGGVWCLIDMAYFPSDERDATPWLIEKVKPIQLSNFDFEQYKQQRARFTTEEWAGFLMQSIGFNPEHFGQRNKLLQLTRLIPFCERNYNLIELGPKGTGKSHIFSEFSPHGMLISGGEVTAAKLFVNNSTGQIGLVGYWDSVAFDEFAGPDKRIPKGLVDIMKNYMANQSFSRGRESMGAEASMSFIGNTKRSVAYMLKHSDLFEQLPPAYYDTAFLDRLHSYLPGWEVEIIRGEMFTQGFGFVVDYLAEVLRYMRTLDYSDAYNAYFKLDDTITTRDKVAIQKTFSGLMKVLYPHQSCTKEEVKELLEFAIESRRRVKLQLMKMDETFREREVRFAYKDLETGKRVEVFTLEELQYNLVRQMSEEEEETTTAEDQAAPGKAPSAPEPEEQHIVIKENQKGISYQRLFAPYLKGATEIHLIDPYLRKFHQVKNLMEFCEMLYRIKPVGDEIRLKVFTNAESGEKQEADSLLIQVQTHLQGTGIDMDYEIEPQGTQHARSIETDTGWKILLDRGLDIFQRYDYKDAFNLANALQEERMCKGFEVTYVRV
ncbi:BREX system Lon protease-like protein BrxL [Phaeodactylibacter luteus]|uniref:BREX system Lon protease-like protein BrxL n=1 Tax=Phaeodactylibacter luteus TaxID=1564516 RepID=A0A5C6S3M2_9BACT|nr:BREX system Lon protease-like protein BrxL [Phaeodactylibacter luteus]